MNTIFHVTCFPDQPMKTFHGTEGMKRSGEWKQIKNIMARNWERYIAK